MKALSHALASALIIGLSFTVTAQAPAFAVGTAHGACSGLAIITAERPAGVVNLGQRASNGYSPWSGHLRMRLDSQGRFQFTCTTTGAFFDIRNETVNVRCPSSQNLVRARYAPGGVEFECIARDHRR